LLDICVFGRRAGKSAGDQARQVEQKSPTLKHVLTWAKLRQEAGLEDVIPSPVILPDYTNHRKVTA